MYRQHKGKIQFHGKYKRRKNISYEDVFFKRKINIQDIGNKRLNGGKGAIVIKIWKNHIYDWSKLKVKKNKMLKIEFLNENNKFYLIWMKYSLFRIYSKKSRRKLKFDSLFMLVRVKFLFIHKKRMDKNFENILHLFINLNILSYQHELMFLIDSNWKKKIWLVIVLKIEKRLTFFTWKYNPSFKHGFVFI